MRVDAEPALRGKRQGCREGRRLWAATGLPYALPRRKLTMPEKSSPEWPAALKSE